VGAEKAMTHRAAASHQVLTDEKPIGRLIVEGET
jgi:hypothetical protein